MLRPIKYISDQRFRNCVEGNSAGILTMQSDIIEVRASEVEASRYQALEPCVNLDPWSKHAVLPASRAN